MKKISADVLMYIQNVKNYFQTNQEAREYFLQDSDEKLFFEHMTQIAQKNYDKNGEAILDRDQFVLLRVTVINLLLQSTSNTNQKQQDVKIKDNIFIELSNFGFICLN